MPLVTILLLAVACVCLVAGVALTKGVLAVVLLCSSVVLVAAAVWSYSGGPRLRR